MRWSTHNITSVAMAYAVTDNIYYSLLTISGVVLPDAIEIRNSNVFRKHRGISHNPLFWILIMPLFAYAIYMLKQSDTGLYIMNYISSFSYLFSNMNLNPFEACFAALFTGIFFHLLIDAMSTYGIPLWGKKKFRLNLYKTFSSREIYITVVILILCLLYKSIFIVARVI